MHSFIQGLLNEDIRKKEWTFEEQRNTTFTQENKRKQKETDSWDKHGNLERVLQPKLGEQCFQEGFSPTPKLNVSNVCTDKF